MISPRTLRRGAAARRTARRGAVRPDPSPLDDAHRLEPGDEARDARAVHHGDHLRHVLVGLAHLLGERLLAAGDHLDAAVRELAGDRAAATPPERLAAGQEAAGAVARA